MRKKSHISLARYIVANTEDEGLKKHWLSFYIGSVLPDCKPSFIYKRHEITGTFPKLRKDIGIDPWKRETFSETEADVLHEPGGDHALRSRLFYLSAQ